MGWFRTAASWLADKISDIKDTLVAIKDGIVDWVCGKKAYSGSSVSDITDMRSDLQKFRDKITPELTEMEKLCVDSAVKEINKCFEGEDVVKSFMTESRKKRLNEKITEIEQLKERKTSENYVQRKFTENDEEFNKILSQQPGLDKGSKMQKLVGQILEEAKNRFVQKISEIIENLCTEFAANAEEDIEGTTKEIQEKESLLTTLQGDADDANAQFRKIQMDTQFIEEMKDSILVIFNE